MIQDDRLWKYRGLAQQKEEQTLHPKAAFSKDHVRFFGPEEDHRLPFKRDVDRIVHSKAYSRYIDKTQVVYLVENDHITHRSLHVQLVSNFARGIAEILRLNIDLVEAISLGHDVGHPPFGHEGEGYLSELSQKHGNGPFVHSWQSCRLFTDIEPLNLGLAVYDGFLCHDGGMRGRYLHPNYGKTWETHFNERGQKLADPEMNIWPGTLEGCLVKLCDTISYLGRDIEDAINLGILKREDIPKTSLGISNGQILTVLARDIIHESFEKDYIAISERAYEDLKTLRAFNFKSIYMHPKLKVESKKIQKSYAYMFETLLEDFEKHAEKSFIYGHFVGGKGERYRTSTPPVQMVVDYMAGMTDHYFVKTLEKILVPKRIELS
jgi:dGTPase